MELIVNGLCRYFTSQARILPLAVIVCSGNPPYCDFNGSLSNTSFFLALHVYYLMLGAPVFFSVFNILDFLATKMYSRTFSSKKTNLISPQELTKLLNLLRHLLLHKAEFKASPKYVSVMCKFDHLFGMVVSTSDCHPRGPGFDSRLCPRNFSGSKGSGTGSTQPREDNWVAI